MQQLYPALLARGAEILQRHPAAVGPEDLVQEAITRWMESGKVLRTPHQMQRWLSTCMDHVAVDWSVRSQNLIDHSQSLDEARGD